MQVFGSRMYPTTPLLTKNQLKFAGANQSTPWWENPTEQKRLADERREIADKVDFTRVSMIINQVDHRIAELEKIKKGSKERKEFSLKELQEVMNHPQTDEGSRELARETIQTLKRAGTMEACEDEKKQLKDYRAKVLAERPYLPLHRESDLAQLAKETQQEKPKLISRLTFRMKKT